MLKQQYFAPNHLFMDDTPYFITGAIYRKRHLLATDELKTRLLSLIKQSFEARGWQLDHWVILNNHYHLLGISKEGRDLTKIIQEIHSKSALWIRQKTQCELPVWWNYWDYCPRNEEEYLIRLNYLLTNPIKHGYVKNLNDYIHSSFQKSFNQMGRDALIRQFKNYSEYKDLIIEEDNL